MRANYIWSNKQIFTSLKKLAKKLGRTPLKREIDACPECPSEWVLYKRFGTLNNAFKKAGLKYKQNRITKEDAFKE